MIRDIKQENYYYEENGYLSKGDNDGNVKNDEYFGVHIFYENGVYNGYKSYDKSHDTGLELWINCHFNENSYDYYL